MPRTVPLRVSLLRSVIILVLAVCAFILGVSYLGANRRLEDLAGTIIGQRLDQTMERLRGFFSPIERSLEIARLWADEGLITIDQRQKLNQLFIPLMKRFPYVTSVIVADTSGREYLVLRESERWINRETRLREWGDRKRWIEWTNQDPTEHASWRDIEYDPSVRPWFRGALSIRDRVLNPPAGGGAENGAYQSEIFWTEPYVFFTANEPGITASTIAPNASTDGGDLIIGLDVLLRDISAFTTTQRVAEHGFLFVGVGEPGSIQIIGLPRSPKFESVEAINHALLKNPDELGLPIIEDAMERLGTDDLPVGQPRSFRSGGAKWWAEYRTLELGVARQIWIGVMVPERDLLGPIEQLRGWIILITAIAIAIMQAMSLSRRFSRPIEALVEETERIRKGDFETSEPVQTSVAEVLRLTAALDRMREGLKSLFRLERDLQIAQSIQKNTFPKSLPIVPGFEMAAMTESADETGGDTYDVVGFRRDRTNGRSRVLLGHEKATNAVFLLADATGHGVGPALSATQVRAMLRIALRLGASLHDVTHHMNLQLYDDLPSGRFVTAWLGEIDCERKTIQSLSAGQGPILHFQASSNEVRSLDADMMPLGIESDFEVPEPVVLAPEIGDIVAVFSDGFFEAKNESDEMFGVERIRRLVIERKNGTPSAILKCVCHHIDEFTHADALDDDRTAIIIKRTA